MKIRSDILALLALTALATACEGEDGGSDDTDVAESDGVDIDPMANPACSIIGVQCDGDVGFLTGTITQDLTLTADMAWVLRGGVFVGNGDDATATLEIEAGTTIFGESSTDGFLTINRGSTILAEGTADAPIVFTSDKESGRARSDWGGLVINGAAPSNVCADPTDCDLPGEAGSGVFGGDDADDDSGVLKYVRVEFAGTLVSATKEINGIAFQGVGRGTEVDYVHAHRCADDGIEFFGGTVDAKHLISTGAGDDGLDWTDGWRGKVQYAIVQFYGDAGDNGIEADNNEESDDASPRSQPMIQNLTVIGGVNMGAPANDEGILLREGTAANLKKAVVLGWGDSCLALDDASTYANAWDGSALTGALTVEDSYFHCPDAPVVFKDTVASPPFTAADFIETLNGGNMTGDPQLEDPQNETAPNYAPKSGSPLLGSTAADFSDGFFEATDFLGAVGSEDWTSWTEFPAN